MYICIVNIKKNIYINCKHTLMMLSIICFILDIDECSVLPSKCDRRAECANTIGSFNCTCHQGYEGDGIVNCLGE